MEKEVFKRRKIDFDLLQKFGFIRENDAYLYEREIYDGMIARLFVSVDGSVKGEVFDADFHEPYVNFRLPSASGAFVVGVREAYRALLEEVASAASFPKVYAGDQANRINDAIFSEYGVLPEFLWKKFPHFGVYRNAASKKWFAIIMDISRGKVFSGDEGVIEVMNLKLGDKSEEFIQEGAAHPAYHMNHDHWVTIVFDDGVPDEKIMQMLKLSFANTAKRKK